MWSAASNNLLVNLIVTLTSSGFLLGVFNFFASRRKTRAEADKTHAEAGKTGAEVGGAAASAAKDITDTALALLEPMRAEMLRLAARVTQQDSEIAELRHTVAEGERSHAVQLRAYADWARLASQKLTAAQIHIDPPPPL